MENNMMIRPSPNWLSARFLIILCVLALIPAGLPAQSSPGDTMIDKYLAQETVKISPRFLDGATSLKEWQDRRPRLRQENLDLLRLWPLPGKTPPPATLPPPLLAA